MNLSEDLQRESTGWLNTDDYNNALHAAFTRKVDDVPILKAHRTFVEKEQYGFGDRPFHYVWHMLVSQMPVEFSFLEIGVFKVILEQVSALQLGDLSHELTACAQEFPLLIEATYNRPLESTREGYLMAVSFEAGRRYAILQAMQLLSEEVDTFSDEKISGDTRPVLSM